jgi:hypothetical protein
MRNGLRLLDSFGDALDEQSRKVLPGGFGNKMVMALATSTQCCYKINGPGLCRIRLEIKHLKYYRKVLPT